MVDVNLKVPALEKLADYAASGIGAVAGPMLATWKAQQDAKARLIGVEAEADSLRMIAGAQANARRALVAPDETGGGTLDIGPDGITQRIEFQEKKRQTNIASVVRDAAAELGDEEAPEHEPDPDWTARFFDCVQDVSSEEMRKLWTKLLSREVEEPGRASLRTLDILRNMTKRDAQIFASVCSFVIDDFIYYPNEHRSEFREPSLHNIISRIALARQSLLNPFERRRGPRDGALAMWEVRRWRAQEGTIGGMPVVEPAVPARAAVAVGT